MPTKKEKSAIANPRRQHVKQLSNEDFILLALLELGGDAKFIDCEDIAYRANKLAPGRFTWVKYRDQINIHTIKTRLWVAKSERGGSLVVGSDRQGWMLTENGLSTIQSFPDAKSGAKDARFKPTPEDEWMQLERTRLFSTDAFLKLADMSAPNPSKVTLSEAEAFFRLNGYIVDKARANKIQKLVNAFGTDPELGPIVRVLAQRLKLE
jgi:hypothetical protein